VAALGLVFLQFMTRLQMLQNTHPAFGWTGRFDWRKGLGRWETRHTQPEGLVGVADYGILWKNTVLYIHKYTQIPHYSTILLYYYTTILLHKYVLHHYTTTLQYYTTVLYYCTVLLLPSYTTTTSYRISEYRIPVLYIYDNPPRSHPQYPVPNPDVMHGHIQA